ncbi:MAG: element excision factor XisI family protein [Chloroflexota bacterium]
MVSLIHEPTTQALAEILKREVQLYAATSDTATFSPILDDTHQVYSVVVIENDPALRPAWVLVMARVVGDKIIIDEDSTLEKHLVDALMVNGGVPRANIVLAYKGEPVPTP